MHSCHNPTALSLSPQPTWTATAPDLFSDSTTVVGDFDYDERGESIVNAVIGEPISMSSNTFDSSIGCNNSGVAPFASDDSNTGAANRWTEARRIHVNNVSKDTSNRSIDAQRSIRSRNRAQCRYGGRGGPAGGCDRTKREGRLTGAMVMHGRAQNGRLEAMDKRKTDPEPLDEHRLQQRQKQIDYGKNTIGYDRYRSAIPIDQRQPGDPRTPDKAANVSKRTFDAVVRNWRRALHKWDPKSAESDDYDDTGVVAMDQLESLALPIMDQSDGEKDAIDMADDLRRDIYSHTDPIDDDF